MLQYMSNMYKLFKNEIYDFKCPECNSMRMVTVILQFSYISSTAFLLYKYCSRVILHATSYVNFNTQNACDIDAQHTYFMYFGRQ